MKHIPIAGVVCVLSAIAGPGRAVEFTGGQIDLSYSGFLGDVEIDGDDRSASKLTLGGQLEVAVTESFSLQGDLAFYEFDVADDTVTSGTLHAILHYDSTLAFGAFIGSDRTDGDDVSFYGIEIGGEYRGVDIEGYLSDGDIDDLTSGTIFGIAANYWVNDEITVGARYDRADLDEGSDVRRLGVMADYSFSPATSIYGELGSAKAEFDGGSDTETYIELGARFTFGAEAGATFGRRGLATLSPGG